MNDRSDPAVAPAPATPLSDPVFLEQLRRQMVRFASLQLGDPHLADDAVQEALMGAMKNVGAFGGRAALKSWVFAILRNKIADQLRLMQRTVNVGSLASDRDADEDLNELFDQKGFWQNDERPQRWDNPEHCLHERQFWRVFEACLEHLPGQQARLFMMREFIELDTGEICASANVTVSNLNVTLHRARLRLRECLENNWFAKEA